MATENVTFVLQVRDTTGRDWQLEVGATVESETEEVEGAPVTTVTSVKLDTDTVSGRIVAES